MKNDAPLTPDVYQALFTDNTCMFTMDHKEAYFLRKPQWSHGVNAET
jgi:hypothetical protein